MIESLIVHCPYCGESFETVVDLSAGSQHYVEDCAVCCRPIELRLRVSSSGDLLGLDCATDTD